MGANRRLFLILVLFLVLRAGSALAIPSQFLCGWSISSLNEDGRFAEVVDRSAARGLRFLFGRGYRGLRVLGGKPGTLVAHGYKEGRAQILKMISDDAPAMYAEGDTLAKLNRYEASLSGSSVAADRESYFPTTRLIRVEDELVLIQEVFPISPAHPEIPAPTLRRWINSGALTPAMRERLTGQLRRAVRRMHDNRVIHRDLKPENILVDAGGNIRLIDFELSSAPDGFPRGTVPGSAVGTPGYQSENMKRGGPAKESDDTEALEVILRETGAK